MPSLKCSPGGQIQYDKKLFYAENVGDLDDEDEDDLVVKTRKDL